MRLEDTPSADGPTALHTLYRGSSLAVRTRHTDRAISGLLAYLHALETAERSGPPRLSTLAFERDGRLVLVPRSLRSKIDQLEPRVRRAGIAVVDQPVIELAHDGRTAVLPSIDGAPAPDGHGGTARELRAAPPGAYEISGRVVVARDELPSRQQLLRGLLADVTNLRQLDGVVSLRAISGVLAAPHRLARSVRATDVVDAVLGAFDG